ncbi:RnfH family protein [Buchnera aphidicola]|uniref:RnfH family protein n=1 Tax=Buchnera aphidicola TaxID=9 RepID=UPI003BEF2FE0
MKKIQVIVVYALSNHQFIYPVNIRLGATVQDAIKKSHILTIFEDINLYKNKVGIYNKIVNLKYLIKNGDRIEIYRSLIIDPKERRRKNFYLKNTILNKR